MAYDKHIWQCGEAITTEKLNHMESGIANASSGDALFVKYDHSEKTDSTATYYFDKTWQEVHDALVAGRAVTANAILQEAPDITDGVMDYITAATEDNGAYRIESVLIATNNARSFQVLSSPSDYLRIVWVLE